jgi:capsular polysaccharide transport system permease protein
MTTKPKVRKYRVERLAPLSAGYGTDSASSPYRGSSQGQSGHGVSAAVSAEPASTTEAAAAPVFGKTVTENEGLTSRQLRTARRVAARHGLNVSSDIDAVNQLRARGIDPFHAVSLLDFNPKPAQGEAASPSAVGPVGRTGAAGGSADLRVNLPQTIPEDQPNLPSTERAPPRETRVNDIGRIQRDIARRRRRNFLALMAKLAVFVGLPTFAAGWYFYVAATPMYATNSEFVIQQADSLGGGGLGGLFQGTSMATQQDSMTVQSYLTSRAAFARLDEEEGFRAHFTDPAIDPIQRLAPESSNEAAFKVYARHVRIGYDPSEGIVRMEVIAADPETSQRFSEALIGYAEEQVDQLTQRLREDRMAGARQSYEEAETRRTAALTEWLRIQQQVQQIDPVGETNARTQQISSLESQRQQLLLELDTRLSVERPNEAQVNSLQMQIANIENLIADLRTEMTQESEAGASLAASNKELRLGEENYAFQTVIVQQALQQMEIARIEANRQVRYLSLGVEPIAPDEATYPRAFENTVVAFLIFSGIYLLISLTAAVLREQVTS